jgi:hypothetical protein
LQEQSDFSGFLVLCSAGDFFGGGNVYNEPKDHFVARMLAYLRYDAVAVGEMDLSRGLDKLYADYKKNKLNLVCANLFRKKAGKGGKTVVSRKPVFPPYRIVSRGGIKIGFIAVLSPRTKVRNPRRGSAKKVEALTYVLKDPAPILEKLVPEVRRKCDILVLLAHMDREDLEKILPDFPQFDFAVLGHGDKTERTKEPYMMGTVPVYKVTFHGQAVGVLRVALDPEGKIADTRNNIYTLNKRVPDDERVAAIIKSFDEENKKKQKELYAKQMLKGNTSNAGPGDIYLGLGNCIRCHADAFRIYAGTKHARAYETLASQFKQRDSSCISCHSTGYGKRGGYTGSRIIGSPVDLVEVQCEACHGPGAEHKRDGTYASRASESCTQCHTKEQDPTFDFSRAWRKIAH